MALLALRRKRVLKTMKLSEKELEENERWMGEETKRRWQ